jgi:hypothetical protein
MDGSPHAGAGPLPASVAAALRDGSDRNEDSAPGMQGLSASMTSGGVTPPPEPLSGTADGADDDNDDVMEAEVEQAGPSVSATAAMALDQALGGKRLGKAVEGEGHPGVRLAHAKFYNKFDDDFDESDMKLE